MSKMKDTLDNAHIVAFCPKRGLLIKTSNKSAFCRVSVVTSFGFNNQNQQKFVYEFLGENTNWDGWEQEKRFWPRIRAEYRALCLKGLAVILPSPDEKRSSLRIGLQTG